MCYTINMLLLGGNSDRETRSLDVSQHIGIDSIKIECANIPSKDLTTVDEEGLSLLEMSDVIAVVVDTPSLMEEECMAISDQVNCVDEIQNLLRDAIIEEKMVVFVPVKCGKWMKERRMKEVLNKLVGVYQSLFRDICSSNLVECCIIPSETIEGELLHCDQLLWHTLGYMAKKEAATTKALRRLGVRYLVPTQSEKIVKKIEELEREGVVINNDDYILIDNGYEIPVIMENFDEKH